MKITRIQRQFLEKLWIDLDKVKLDIILILLGKRPRQCTSYINLNNPEGLNKVMPTNLLIHLTRVRATSRTKLERFRVVTTANGAF